MPRYHVSPKTGVPSACRAKVKCPFGAPDEHFPAKEDALKYIEGRAKLEDILSKQSKTALKETTLHALNSPMNYQGPLPAWLADSKSKAAEALGQPSGAELLDVMAVNGRATAIVWEQFSSDSSDFNGQVDRGYEVNRLLMKDFETGEVMGFLKTAYATEASLARSFGTDGYAGLRWLNDYSGSHLGITELTENPFSKYERVDTVTGKEGDELLAAKKKLWARAHAGMNETPEGFDRSTLTWGSLINLKSEHAPKDEAQLDADIARLNAIALEKQKDFKRGVNTPSIDYSQIEDGHRGQGLGQALYVYTARKLGSQGYKLRASGLQTNEAENVWKRMAADERMNMTITDSIYINGYSFKRASKLAMDFTS